MACILTDRDYTNIDELLRMRCTRYFKERSFNSLRVDDLKKILRYLKDTYRIPITLSGRKQELVDRLNLYAYAQHGNPITSLRRNHQQEAEQLNRMRQFITTPQFRSTEDPFLELIQNLHVEPTVTSGARQVTLELSPIWDQLLPALQTPTHQPPPAHSLALQVRLLSPEARPLPISWEHGLRVCGSWVDCGSLSGGRVARNGTTKALDITPYIDQRHVAIQWSAPLQPCVFLVQAVRPRSFEQIVEATKAASKQCEVQHQEKLRLYHLQRAPYEHQAEQLQSRLAQLRSLGASGTPEEKNLSQTLTQVREILRRMKPPPKPAAASVGGTSSSSSSIGADDDDALEICEFELSLRCPLTYRRLKYPAKGKDCKHAQCFDLEGYLMYARSQNRWQCPICNKRVPFDAILFDFRTDQIVREVSERPNGDSIDRVVVHPSGTFSAQGENEESSSRPPRAHGVQVKAESAEQRTHSEEVEEEEEGKELKRRRVDMESALKTGLSTHETAHVPQEELDLVVLSDEED